VSMSLFWRESRRLGKVRGRATSACPSSLRLAGAEAAKRREHRAALRLKPSTTGRGGAVCERREPLVSSGSRLRAQRRGTDRCAFSSSAWRSAASMPAASWRASPPALAYRRRSSDAWARRRACRCPWPPGGVHKLDRAANRIDPCVRPNLRTLRARAREPRRGGPRRSNAPRVAAHRAQRRKSPISSWRWRSVSPATVLEGAIRHWVSERAALAGPTFGSASRRS
jgi:hypothetical protein